jgi:hypothetical protein
MQNNQQGGKSGGLSWSTPQGSNSNNQNNQQNQQKPATQPTPVVQKPLSSAPQPTLTPAASSTGKSVGLVVGGIILGVLLAWAFSAMRGGSANDTTTGTATSTASTTAKAPTAPTAPSVLSGSSQSAVTDTGIVGTTAANLIINSQAAGKTVTVSKAVVSQPTWVVVYETLNGQPSRALGAALFFPGAQTGSVQLLRATTAGKTYLATLQTDNGNRKFELHQDPMVIDGGKPVWVTFQAQ